MYDNPIVGDDLDALAADPRLDWERLRNRTVLVTGINGMIASYLLLTLLRLNDRRDLGVRVVGVARNESKARQRFAAVVDRPDLTLVAQDLAEPLRHEGAVDLVVHAASQTSPQHFTTDPVGTIDGNVLGTRNLLQWSHDHGVGQFLFLSTREIYGGNPEGREFVTEDQYGPIDPTAIRSCYPESKRLGEAYCVGFRSQYGLDTRIARIAHSYGPGMVIGDGRVVGDFLRCTVDGTDIAMISDGSGRLALTYIADVIAGLFLFLQTDETLVNISQDEQVVTIRELAELLAELNPNPDAAVVFAPAPASVHAGYLARPPAFLASSRIAAHGWAPATGLRDGMARTVAYLRGAGS